MIEQTLAVPGAHARPGIEVAALVGADPDLGLSKSQASQRLERDGPNELSHGRPPSWFDHLIEEFRNPLVILLLVAVVISLVAWFLEGGDGIPYDAIAISAILTINAAIGTVQARRADNATAALQRLAAPHARVIRDGVVEKILTSELVVGDLIVVEAGDAVPADARLLTCHSLQAAEAPLTGESLSVDKSVEPVAHEAFVGDRSSMVFSGTAIVAGRGTAVVVATAMRTEVGKVASMLHGAEAISTPLQREVTSLGRLLGSLVVIVALVVMAVLLVTSDIQSTSDAVDVLLIGVSLAVAAVPEGLPAVLSVVLAVSVQRMAARNALVKRLSSAETLGSATVICTDKTGTLTRSEMTVRVALVGEARADISGVGYGPDGLITVGGEEPSEVIGQGLGDLFRSAVLSCDATIEQVGDDWRAKGSPTEAALVTAASKLEGGWAEQEPQRISELAFTSERKRMSVLVGSPEAAEATMITKGAPDVLLARCDAEWDGSVSRLLTTSRREWWLAQVESLANEGFRTLAVARRQGMVGPLSEDQEEGMELLGVVGIDDPPRIEAAVSVKAARESGIRVVMVTGDHPGTARRIARSVGIAEHHDSVVTGVEIDAMNDEQFAVAAATTSVFARVTPAHKLRLVRALRGHGEVVAMTGDGVNDAPALKAADLGAAMGQTGTDVAREAADMILLDDNFATIVAAVSEGRTIWHNIQSFMRYLLSSNVGEVFTVLFGILLAGVVGLSGDGVEVVLTASQILWINLITDAAPALALGIDPVESSVMGQPPRSSTERVVGRRMISGIAVVGVAMAAVTLLMFDLKHGGGLFEGDETTEYARTAAFTVLVFAQVFNAFNARSDVESARHTWARNRWLLSAAALAVVLQLAVVHLGPLNEAFSTSPLSLSDWLLCAVLASVVLWVVEIRKWFIRRSL